jgi:16S rRNA processing protein RimM
LNFTDLLVIGRVVKPQGRKGELLIAPLSDRPERFASLRRVFVPTPDGGSRELTVTSSWPHKGRFVLKFQGVDSIDDAERYRGLELGARGDDLAPLPPGSYYHHELLGLRVEETSGKSLGRVVDLLETGGAAKVLVIRGDGGESLIPWAVHFVHKVDVAGGTLVVTPVETVSATD